MHPRGPIAQPGSELPAHNRLVPGSNPGGPISFVSALLQRRTGLYSDNDTEKKPCATRITLVEDDLREEINRLMDLQVIDRQLQELEQSLTSIAGRVDQLRDENKSNQAELDRLTEQDKEITAARKKAERELAEGEVRIRNKRMRLTLVRNDKELQALTHEIESLKETNQRLETELLTSMEGADARTARIKELTEAIAKGPRRSDGGGKRNRGGSRRAQGQYRQDSQGARESRRECRCGPALALPDDFQPSRRRRGGEGDRRNLPGMPDASAAPAVQRDPEASADPLLPELPARAVLRGAGAAEGKGRLAD